MIVTLHRFIVAANTTEYNNSNNIIISDGMTDGLSFIIV